MSGTESGTGIEVPWPDKLINGVMYWHTAENIEEGCEQGYLHFYGPDGKKAVIPVTKGKVIERANRGPVWHISIRDGIATVSPSVHFVGAWHSPNPVQFQLVEALDS